MVDLATVETLQETLVKKSDRRAAGVSVYRAAKQTQVVLVMKLVNNNV